MPTTNYAISYEAQGIVDWYWGKEKSIPTPSEFLAIQRELIELHFPKMSDETKERAVKTLKHLETTAYPTSRTKAELYNTTVHSRLSREAQKKLENQGYPL